LPGPRASNASGGRPAPSRRLGRAESQQPRSPFLEPASGPVDPRLPVSSIERGGDHRGLRRRIEVARGPSNNRKTGWPSANRLRTKKAKRRLGPRSLVGGVSIDSGHEPSSIDTNDASFISSVGVWPAVVEAKRVP